MEFGGGSARGVAVSKSKATDPKETERRVSAALGKHERGENVSGRDRDPKHRRDEWKPVISEEDLKRFLEKRRTRTAPW